MRFKYKVRELIADKVLNNEKIENVLKPTDMEAMSFKKLRKKLDPKKRYFVEYTNKKGNEVVIPQKMNRCIRRFPLRVLLSAAAANAAATFANEGNAMRIDIKGESKVSGAMPAMSKGAEMAIEYALIAYAQSAFHCALGIKDGMGVHKKVTSGSMQAGIRILNRQLQSCTGLSPGAYTLDKKIKSARTRKNAKAEIGVDA